MSLHTKYRPQAFGDVIGQDHISKSLKRVIADQRAKSFIFVGPSGTGKTTLARIMANAFAGGTATQANVEEIDAATNSGADDMRAVIRRSYSRAIGSSPAKTIIVDEAHRLSAAAWTILLKPVEEPPRHVYWVFCTTDAGKIPKTIATRCLKYELRPVSDERIYELLYSVVQAERLGTGEDIIEACAENAAGSPRQALVNLELCATCQSVAEAQAALKAAAQGGDIAALCRWLISGRGHSWAEALKHVQALAGVDPEGVRIGVVNYLSAVLLNTKGNDRAKQLLALMEPFLTSYNASDKMAPLLHSLGLALNLDQ